MVKEGIKPAFGLSKSVSELTKSIIDQQKSVDAVPDVKSEGEKAAITQHIHKVDKNIKELSEHNIKKTFSLDPKVWDEFEMLYMNYIMTERRRDRKAKTKPMSCFVNEGLQFVISQLKQQGK